MPHRVPSDPSVPSDPDLRFARTRSEAFGAGVRIHLEDERDPHMLRSERNAALACFAIIVVSMILLFVLK